MEVVRGVQYVCLCETVPSILPVVLMPPTVGELQAQLVGYLLGLYTAALSFPSVLLSLPPADYANSPSVALIHSFPGAWTHTKVSKHVCIYICIVIAHSTLLTSSLCWNTTYNCCPIFGSCHILPNVPLVSRTVVYCVTAVNAAAYYGYINLMF